MFKTARLKLTAWYLLIIMIVSFAFSTIIYRAASTELERFSRLQRLRFETQYIPGLPTFHTTLIEPPEPDLLAESKHRLLLFLGLINTSIFVISGGLGFILAGRTLEPIEKMVEEQKQFVSDSSHELRTPITALKSNLEVALRDKKLNTRSARYTLKESLEDVNRLQNLSEKLLNLSNYGSALERNSTPLNLIDEISCAIKALHPLASQKHITISKKVEKLNVVARPGSLTELMTILLENAIQYSKPRTHIAITARSSKDSVIISIKDKGIGIAPKDLPHIFDRFYRADTSRSFRSEQGYGLGLSIAKGIVESYGGVITAESRLGEGSTFTVRLPISANIQK